VAWGKAETLFQLWMMDDALAALARFQEEYPEHERVTDGSADWFTADIYWRTNARQKAYGVLTEFLADHPRAAAWRKAAARRRIDIILGRD
jgi:hypothetical protein